MNSTNGGIRNGFLELNDYEWKRKRDWRNWYGSREGGTTRVTPTSLSILNQETGWLAVDGKLYKRSHSYSSGGWEFVPNPFTAEQSDPGTITEVFFVDAQHGWLLSSTGEIALTTNGGKEWDPSPVELGNSLAALFFLDSSNGWMVADDTYLLQTQNGGKDWKRMGFLWIPGSISQLHFADENHAWLVVKGNAAPSHTENGGLTWVHPTQEKSPLQSVYFWDQFHGWAIHPGVGIVHTADGGRNWVQQDISDYWHEHPMNVIWKTPVWIIGTIAMFIASIFEGLPEEFDTLPLLPILQI
ncbi:MAG: YCF48-related protein [Nitrospirota bacterium]|nr:YCF48-related protein [Nitrospirota bacterium]